ncbi:zinc finger BED domain-containing protein 1-like [Diachasma alloeum]|uniref:zinc finger BED domain-containing protein 1-like n=1 Tax=Diachasma alloeum TaxID=454923 RepID=UPI00073841D6|nr:zinc finger BED domain-containing protein 1-like [Diachasma alloeum]
MECVRAVQNLEDEEVGLVPTQTGPFRTSQNNLSEGVSVSSNPPTEPPDNFSNTKQQSSKMSKDYKTKLQQLKCASDDSDPVKRSNTTKRPDEKFTSASTSTASFGDCPAPSSSYKYGIRKGKQPSIVWQHFERNDASSATCKHCEGGDATNRITMVLLFLLCVAKLPLSFVENAAFKLFMKVVAPLYTLPSRKTITTKMQTRYEMLKQAFKQVLAEVGSYTLTCDNWTDVSNKSYLGVTIHWLSSNLKMRSGSLGVIPLSSNHTIPYLLENLLKVIEDFGLDLNKISAVVSDSAANIKGAVKELIGSLRQLACFAHIISHLIPKTLASFDQLKEIISKVKHIVALTRHSTVATDELLRLQQRDGKVPLKFIMDVPTRWNYTLTMIRRFLELEEYVYPVMMKCKNTPNMLTREEILILNDLVRLMEPVENAIGIISGSTYATATLVIPLIREMFNSIARASPGTKLGKEFQTALTQRLDEAVGKYEFHEVLGKATVLDPRFKKIPFTKPLAAANHLESIDKMLKESLKENDGDKREKSTEEEVPKDVLGIWDLHDELVKRQVPEEEEGGYHSELRQFLKLPVISRHDHPFEYWEKLKPAYPTLYSIAIKWLSIITTSVPSERLFSKAGKIKDDDRSRLTGENLNKLLFLGSLTREE